MKVFLELVGIILVLAGLGIPSTWCLFFGAIICFLTLSIRMKEKV